MPNTYDDSTWPTCLVTWPSEPVTEDVFEGWLRALVRWLARNERFAAILDMRASPGLLAPMRKHLSVGLAARKEPLTRQLVMAMVLDSAAQRGGIVAFNWLFPPPYPQRVFATPAAARPWCAAEVAQRPGTAPRAATSWAQRSAKAR